MATRHGFLTAGTWCLDQNITLDHWPEEDLSAVVQDEAQSGGGSACNFAVDMRKLNLEIPVETQGLIGTDAEGDFLLSVADTHGIDRRGLIRSDTVRTQFTEAYQSLASGRRTHIIYHRAATFLAPEHFDFSATNAR